MGVLAFLFFGLFVFILVKRAERLARINQWFLFALAFAQVVPLPNKLRIYNS